MQLTDIRVLFLIISLLTLEVGPCIVFHLPQEDLGISSHLRRREGTHPSKHTASQQNLLPRRLATVRSKACSRPWVSPGRRLSQHVSLLPSLDRWPCLALRAFFPPFWIEPLVHWPPLLGALAPQINRSLVWLCLLQARLLLTLRQPQDTDQRPCSGGGGFAENLRLILNSSLLSAPSPVSGC